MNATFLYPESGNYPVYYENYFRLVDKQNDIIQQMNEDAMKYKDSIAKIPENKLSFAYGEGKWNSAELIQHIIDTERVFLYRSLSIARADKTPLSSFNENLYVKNASILHKPKELLALEWFATRQASIAFYIGLTTEEIVRTGIVNNNLVSVSAIAYLSVGHARHHFNVLQEKYL